MIEVNNKKKTKPNLKQMFDDYIEKCSKVDESLLGSPEFMKYLVKRYGAMDIDDDEFDYEEYEDDIFDGYSKSKKKWKQTREQLIKSTKKNKKDKKRGKRGNKKKKPFVFDEEDIKFDALSNDDKVIYYYRDVNDPDQAEIFFNLHDFDNFLTEEGIEVTQEEVNNLMINEVTHCCINPDIRQTNGEVQLITDTSYGGLYWTCNPENVYSMLP